MFKTYRLINFHFLFSCFGTKGCTEYGYMCYFMYFSRNKLLLIEKINQEKQKRSGHKLTYTNNINI